jgi:hypothetical protein
MRVFSTRWPKKVRGPPRAVKTDRAALASPSSARAGRTRFRLYRDSNGNRKVEITGHSPCVMGSGMCGENATNR